MQGLRLWPRLLPQGAETPAVLKDVFCSLVCFSTGVPGGWHKVHLLMQMMQQPVVPVTGKDSAGDKDVGSSPGLVFLACGTFP